MSKKTFKTVLVGLGKIGLEYDLRKRSTLFCRTHAKAVSIHKNFNLIAAVDKVKKKRDIFNKIYNRPTFAEFSKNNILAETEFAIIASDTKTHLEMTKKIISSCKNIAGILIEKPMSGNVKEAQKILNICKKHKIKLYVNYVRIYDSSVKEIKKILSINKSNNYINGNIYYSKGFIHNGSHFISLCDYLFGNLNSFKLIKNKKIRSQNDYLTFVHLNYEKACVCIQPVEKLDKNYQSIEFISNRRRIFWDNSNNIVISDIFNTKKNSKLASLNNSFKTYQLSVMEQIYMDLKNKPANICDGSQGLKVLKNIEMITKGI